MNTHTHTWGEPRRIYFSRGGMGDSLLMKECECGIRERVQESKDYQLSTQEKETHMKTFLGTTFIIMLIGFAIGAVLWPYTLNTWLVFFGKDPVITWWQGGLIGFVPWIGHASIPAAVVTWILMLFIG